MANSINNQDDDEQEVIRSMQAPESTQQSQSQSQSQSDPILSSSRIMASHAPLSSYHTLNALQILNESVAALRSTSTIFTHLALLTTPFSLIVLSQPWIVGDLPQRLAATFQRTAHAQSLWFHPTFTAAAFKLSDNLIAHAFQFPFFIALALPARATLAWAIALHYSAKPFHLHAFLHSSTAFRACLRATVTYLWICTLMFVCMIVILFLLVVTTTVSQAAGLSVDLLFLLLAAIALGFSLLFAHLVIISDLAITISILEEIQGRIALMKAILMLRGRTQVGLLLFIISTAATASIDGLFQYRVVGTPSYKYKIDLSSKLWEMPLLVAMYSFLYLFESIPSTIFYFTCKSACCESFDRFSLESTSKL